MSLRRRFALILATYGVAAVGVMALVSWKVARDALEGELDRRLLWVAGAAVETGLEADADLLLSLEEGLEDTRFYDATQAKLDSLTRYVEEAFVFQIDHPDRRLLISSEDEPIGTPLFFLASHLDEILEANAVGEATTDVFPVDGRP